MQTLKQWQDEHIGRMRRTDLSARKKRSLFTAEKWFSEHVLLRMHDGVIPSMVCRALVKNGFSLNELIARGAKIPESIDPATGQLYPECRK